MYVRWKVRRRAYQGGNRWDHHARAWRREAVMRTAVLAETKREPGGRVRQRFVATVGSLDAIWLDRTAGVARVEEGEQSVARYRREAAARRIQFWRRARGALGALLIADRITREQCAAFADQIAATVPLPAAADFDQMGEHRDGWIALWEGQDAEHSPAGPAFHAVVPTHYTGNRL